VRYDKKCILVFKYGAPDTRQILRKLEFSGKIIEKILNVKFHKNPPNGKRVVPCGQTGGRMDRWADRQIWQS